MVVHVLPATISTACSLNCGKCHTAGGVHNKIKEAVNQPSAIRGLARRTRVAAYRSCGAGRFPSYADSQHELV